MPLANYGVLKGKAIDAKREDDQSTPHYQVHILAGSAHNRIAVNAKSQTSPSELLFLVDDNFQHPLTGRLPDLAQGFTLLPRTAAGQGLDYIRGNLFNRLDMRPLPSNLPGPGAPHRLRLPGREARPNLSENRITSLRCR